jgi:hypothetical protein
MIDAEKQACPGCNAEVDGLDRYCGGCGDDLSPLFAETWAVVAEERAALDFAERGAPEVPEGTWRKFRIGTVVALVLLVASVVGVGVALAIPGSGPGTVALVATLVILALTFAVVSLARVLADRKVRPPGELGDAGIAFRTFLHTLLQKRWAYAWHLLLPTRRGEERRRPEMRRLGASSLAATFDAPTGIRAYWKTLLHAGWFRNRVATLRDVEVEADGTDRAVARAVIVVRTHSPWLLLLILLGTCGIALLVLLLVVYPTRVELVVETRLVRIGGRWFVHDASLVPQLQETP